MTSHVYICVKYACVQGLPWWRSGWEVVGCSGRSHMPRSSWARAPQLLSLRPRACEPQLLSPRATTTEARVPRARALQRESPPQ